MSDSPYIGSEFQAVQPFSRERRQKWRRNEMLTGMAESTFRAASHTVRNKYWEWREQPPSSPDRHSVIGKQQSYGGFDAASYSSGKITAVYYFATALMQPATAYTYPVNPPLWWNAVCQAIMPPRWRMFLGYYADLLTCTAKMFARNRWHCRFTGVQMWAVGGRLYWHVSVLISRSRDHSGNIRCSCQLPIRHIPPWYHWKISWTGKPKDLMLSRCSTA